ncbi:MAG: hypothetical protein KH372_08675 [Olsenella uli]|uniref:phage baseplate protein n=1 Tax=Olsenella uli TaxID=133926 RepID=UPI001DAAF927|nr:hypothetical protein [Olsenella uli]MBS6418876.1 hypothetical protein [Olsenella uli]
MSTKTANLKLVKPDVTDEVGQTVRDLAANFDALDAMWPVGSIYQSTRPTDPGTFLGGTWVRLEGRFLLGAGAAHAPGQTGGEEEHTLTVAEMPRHQHRLWTSAENSGSGNWWSYVCERAKGIWFGVEETQIEPSGSSRPHNNMPPFLAVYMWERTA